MSKDRGSLWDSCKDNWKGGIPKDLKVQPRSKDEVIAIITAPIEITEPRIQRYNRLLD